MRARLHPFCQHGGFERRVLEKHANPWSRFKFFKRGMIVCVIVAIEIGCRYRGYEVAFVVIFSKKARVKRDHVNNTSGLCLYYFGLNDFSWTTSLLSISAGTSRAYSRHPFWVQTTRPGSTQFCPDSGSNTRTTN